MTHDSLLFYAVYLSQIAVISLYLPAGVVRRAHALMERLPAAEYPKLYPEPPENLVRRLRIYRNLNTGVALLGFGLLAAAPVTGYPIGRFNDADPVAIGYTVLQILPHMLLGASEAGYFRRMRAMARDRIRTAQLEARRAFDFLPPKLVFAAVAMYLAATALLLSVDGPRWSRFAQIANITLCNLLLAGVIVWNLYGRKQDPHQTHADRARQIRLVARIMLVLSILLSTFTMINAALNALELDRYGPLLTSLFLQIVFAISLIRFLSIRLEQQSFEAYRRNTNHGAAQSIE